MLVAPVSSWTDIVDDLPAFREIVLWIRLLKERQRIVIAITRLRQTDWLFDRRPSFHYNADVQEDNRH